MLFIVSAIVGRGRQTNEFCCFDMKLIRSDIIFLT